MTNEEAIKHINVVKSRIRGGDEAYDLQRKEALNIAIEALEKQIPKKLIKNVDDELECPRCHCELQEKIDYLPNYCDYCGQAIDWEDDE